MKLQKMQMLLFSIPEDFINSELKKIKVDISKKVVISGIKGIVPESGLLVGEAHGKKFPNKK